ncbi:flagellar biosynthesis protein FliQ [bacterium]|nr:flagellar biosynthesis protein FliQ [bacterium]
MNELVVMKLAKDALLMVTLASGPALGLGLFVGLVVSVFQAVTSIQEMTLAIIPKIFAVFIALLVFGPFIIKMLTSFAYQIFSNIPNFVR